MKEMKANLRQILATLVAMIITVSLIIILAPFILFIFVFALICVAIAIFLLRIKLKKMIKENPDLFKNARFNQKGRIIDEEEVSQNTFSDDKWINK